MRWTFPRCRSLHVELLENGVGGEPPRQGDVVAIDYACLLAESGRLVDSSRAIGQNSDRFKKPFTAVIGAGAIVNGMDAGLRRMTLGTLARLHA